MALTIENEPDFDKFLNKHNVNVLNNICIIPNGFNNDEIDSHFASTLPTVMKILKNGNLQVGLVGGNEKALLLDQRSIEWFSPIFLIGSMFYSQNPEAVSIALSMIANYLTAIFSGKPKSVANFTIYLHDDQKKLTKRVNYKGDVAGISELSKVIESTMKEFSNEQKK